MRICLMMLAVMVMASGCGKEAITDKAKRATNKAGQMVGEGAGNFFTGVGEGIEKAVTSYDVRLSDDLKAKGISITIAKHSDAAGSGRGLSLYILNKEAVAGSLRMKLFTDKDQEIGRASADIDFKADDARYVQFVLDREVPVSMTAYVKLDLKQDPE